MSDPSGESAGSMLRPDVVVSRASPRTTDGGEALRGDASSRSVSAIATPATVSVRSAAVQRVLSLAFALQGLPLRIRFAWHVTVEHMGSVGRWWQKGRTRPRR